MKVSQLHQIQSALVLAQLTAQRHAATSENAELRHHYERQDQQINSALRTLDSLTVECQPDERKEAA